VIKECARGGPIFGFGFGFVLLFDRKLLKNLRRVVDDDFIDLVGCFEAFLDHACPYHFAGGGAEHENFEYAILFGGGGDVAAGHGCGAICIVTWSCDANADAQRGTLRVGGDLIDGGQVHEDGIRRVADLETAIVQCFVCGIGDVSAKELVLFLAVDDAVAGGEPSVCFEFFEVGLAVVVGGDGLGGGVHCENADESEREECELVHRGKLRREGEECKGWGLFT
jgi:hypothetical protein